MLYVDEINLLADHLVDALLDVAVSGVNRIERDGISHTHPARFVLVGSMNPEEGELRPQLLDRFGLAVDVTASAGRRRLEPTPSGASWRPRATDEVEPVMSRRTTSCANACGGPGPRRSPTRSWTRPARLAVAVGAEGLRADLMLCRAAAMHAGW